MPHETRKNAALVDGNVELMLRMLKPSASRDDACTSEFLCIVC